MHIITSIKLYGNHLVGQMYLQVGSEAEFACSKKAQVVLFQRWHSYSTKLSLKETENPTPGFFLPE